MKKILLITILCLGFFASAQTPVDRSVKVDAVKFRGTVTNTTRGFIDVDPGEWWLVYNTDTNTLQIGDETENWTDLGGGGGSTDGVVSSVSLVGNNLVFSGTNGGFTGSIDITPILAQITGSETAFAAWDKNTADDFDGTYASLTGKPANIDEDSTDDFSGSWNDLIDIPAGFADGVDNTAAGTDDQTAAEVPFTPYSTITSTDTQAAVQELKDEVDALATNGTGIVAEGSFTTSSGGDFVQNHNLGYAPDLSRINVVKLNGSTTVPPNYFIDNITSTTLTITLSNVSGTVEIGWAVFGTDTATPLSGSEVVTSINAELGNTDWQGGGGSSYNAPINFTLSTGSNVLTDANIHSGANPVINVYSGTGTVTTDLTDLNPSEVDVLGFNVDNASGILEITSTNGFLSSQIGSNTAVRITGIGAVTFEETGANTGIFRIYPGDNVTYFTPDTTAPTLVSAVIEDADPDLLVVTFNEDVSSPNASFTNFDGTLNTISIDAVNVAGSSGTVIAYDLSPAVTNGLSGNLVYGASNNVTDTAGNSLGATSIAVTNNVVGCSPDANEQHTESNAASDPNCNEANATTGWSNVGGTLTSDTDSDTGTYALKHVSSDGSNDRAEYNLTITNGDTFDISFRAKGTGDAKMTLWTNLTGSPNNVSVTGTYTTYNYSVTATATGTAILRFYSSQGGSASDEIFIDNLSIIKTN